MHVYARRCAVPEWLQTVRCASKSSQPFDPTRYNSTQHTGRFHLGPSGCTEPCHCSLGLARASLQYPNHVREPARARRIPAPSRFAAVCTLHSARGMLHAACCMSTGWSRCPRSTPASNPSRTCSAGGTCRMLCVTWLHATCLRGACLLAGCNRRRRTRKRAVPAVALYVVRCSVSVGNIAWRRASQRRMLHAAGGARRNELHARRHKRVGWSCRVLCTRQS